MVPRRLRRLPEHRLADGTRLFVARSFAARLLGLGLMAAPPDDCALLIERCRAIHTCGMRFAIDVEFVDERGEVLRRVRVRPWRAASCRGAAAVIERPVSDRRRHEPAEV
jgi:uncharacterized membrane protein (UPF0127 family)